MSNYNIPEYIPNCACGNVYILQRTCTTIDANGKKKVEAFYKCQGCGRDFKLTPYREL